MGDGKVVAMSDFGGKRGGGIAGWLGRKFQDARESRAAERDARRAARDEAMDAMVERFAEQNNIAAYFNQRHRDIPGYTLSIRRNEFGRVVELETPFNVGVDAIAAIQRSEDVFLVGHSFAPDGVVVDIYGPGDSGEIAREYHGQRDVLRTDDLERYELERRASKKRIGPNVRVIAVDDLSDVPIR